MSDELESPGDCNWALRLSPESEDLSTNIQNPLEKDESKKLKRKISGKKEKSEERNETNNEVPEKKRESRCPRKKRNNGGKMVRTNINSIFNQSTLSVF